MLWLWVREVAVMTCNFLLGLERELFLCLRLETRADKASFFSYLQALDVGKEIQTACKEIEELV